MLCQIVVTLLLTPFVLSHLGLEAYGLWLLLQGLVGYYGLVDMGLRAGITQSVTNRIAAEDFQGVRGVFATAIPVLLKLVPIVVVISCVGSLLLPILIDTNPALSSVFPWLILIQGVGVAIRLPLLPYSSVLVGLQRYDIANGIAIGTRVLYACIAALVLAAGGGLITLSLTLVATNLIDSLVRRTIAHRLVPELANGDGVSSKADFSELVQFGFWNFLIQITQRLIYYSDTLIVGALFSAAAIAPYALAGSLVGYCNSLVKVSTRVLYPTMASLQVNDELQRQRVLYSFATRICAIVSLAFVAIGYLHLSRFLDLWLKSSPDRVPIVEQGPFLFLLIGISFSFVSLRRPGHQLLIAAGRLKQLALLQAVEVVANLIFSIGLGFYMGVPGIAIGMMIPAVLLCFFGHMKAHSAVLETTLHELLYAMIFRVLAYATCMLVLVGLASVCLQGVSGWFGLVLSVSICVMSALVAVPVGLSKEERTEAVRMVGSRIRKVRRNNASMKAIGGDSAQDA